MNDEIGPDLVLRRSPLLFLSAALAAGEIIDRQVNLSCPWLVFLTLGAGALAACAHLFETRGSLRIDSNPARIDGVIRAPHKIPRIVRAPFLILLSFVAAGALLHGTARLQLQQSPLRRQYEQRPEWFTVPVELRGRLATSPRKAPNRIQVELEVEDFRYGGVRVPASGSAELTVPAAGEDAREVLRRLGLKSGTRITAWATLDRMERYRNPGGLSLNAFLERNGFDLMGVIKNPRLIEIVDRERESGILNAFAEARARGETALERTFPSRTAAVLNALLLGNRQFIGRGTADIFRAGGTFHILVISGAHVAFIAAGLYWILKSLTSRRWIHFTVVSAGVWSYLLLIGWRETPVLRATIMISAVLLGRMLFRRAVLPNAIGLAAMVILSISPLELFSAGFQLTFVAVLGIGLIAGPAMRKLRQVGTWRPRAATPHPPKCPGSLRRAAEALFWDTRGFRRELADSPVRFRLQKSAWAERFGSAPLLQAIPRGLAISLFVSLSIQVVMVPAAVFYFHRASPAGVILNMSVGLLTGMTMLSGLLTCAACTAFPSCTPALRELTVALATWTSSSAQPLLAWPFSQWRVPEYRGFPAILYFALTAGLLFLAIFLDRWNPVEVRREIEMSGAPMELAQAGDSNPPKPAIPIPCKPGTSVRFASFVMFSTLLTLVVVLWHPGGVEVSEGWLTVHFLDVQQGDAIFVEFPAGRNMLVDGGGRPRPLLDSGESEGVDAEEEDRPRVGESVVAPFLWSKGLSRVDYLVPSHSDLDHLQGCVDIARNFSIGEVWLAREPFGNSDFEDLNRVVVQKRVLRRRIAGGDRFQIDGVQVDVLWPDGPVAAGQPWENNQSVVLRLAYGEDAVLLTGDLGREGEAGLLSSGRLLKSRIIKVPHHGSRTSSSLPFLSAVDPAWAIISVGSKSPFGHPHPEVLRAYRSRNARVVRTGDLGTITVRTDGHQLKIDSFVYGKIRE